jgi:hypothetical protein
MPPDMQDIFNGQLALIDISVFVDEKLNSACGRASLGAVTSVAMSIKIMRSRF